MPQTYTFGPKGGGIAPPPEEKKKQAYSFGPVGGGAKTTPPQADASPVDIPALATKYGLDPEIIGKQVQQESGGKQSAVSPKGAVGIMQLMPETAKRLGVDRHDVHQNAEGGIREMQRLLGKYKGDYRKALAAYNAGETHVDKAGGVPDIEETKNYVEKIMGPEKPPVAPPPVTAKPSEPPQEPGFGMGLVQGSMFDATKLAEMEKFKLGDKIYSQQHPMYRMGGELVKQAAKGLGDWMEATAKDPFHVVDPVITPLSNLATQLEYHGGQKVDPYDLHQVNAETAVHELARALKTNDSTAAANAAGKLVGAFTSVMMMKKAPEAAKKVGGLPDALSIAKEAKTKSIVTAAANNVLHDDRPLVLNIIKQAVGNTQQSIGRRFKNGADADLADNARQGRSYTYGINDVAQKITDTIRDTKAERVSKPGVASLAKELGRYQKQGGLTLEDMKDFRQKINSVKYNASGKDLAILGKLDAWAKDQMASRFTQLGKADAWKEYTENTIALNKHKEGLIKRIDNTDTGLKMYTELAKESNKPELNDMFNLLERHGGVPRNFIQDMIKSRKPVFDLAKRAEGGDESGGRMSSLLRHPLAAGTAFVGVGGAGSLVSGLSPVGMGGSFVASLIAAKKVSDFIDRYDAVKAMRSIRRQGPSTVLQGMPTPFPGGAAPQTPTGGATPSPVGPGAPPMAPTSGSGGPVSPSVGAPAAPATLEGLMGRIKESMKPVKQPERRSAVRMGTPLNIQRTYRLNQMREQLQSGKLSAAERDTLQRQYVSMKAHPEDLPPEGDLKSMKVQPKKMSKEEAEAEQVKRHGSPQSLKSAIKNVTGESQAPAKTEKQTPYEEFGVKIDRSRLTTPEAVREAKADAKRQIEELGRVKYTEAAKLPVGEARTAALDKLKTDVAKASRSVDKMQTPEVSRKQRDVLRKAVDAGKIKPAERSALEGMSPEQVEQKASAGVTDDEANMMEMIDLGREAEAAGSVVKGVYEQIYKKTGGDPRTSLPMLRALMEQVRKAKKPAAD